MEIKNIQNNQKEIFIKNLEKGFIVSNGVYADNFLNRKLGRVGQPYKKGEGNKNEEESIVGKVKGKVKEWKDKASKILKKKDEKEPEGDNIMKEIEKYKEAQKDSIEKLNKLKWTIKKSDKFKTRNGHPATDRISINIERPEGPNSDDFTEIVDNIYIDTPKGKIYDIGEGRYAIPHPEYEKGKNNNGIPQYRNVDAKGAADFLDGKDFYDISSESYHRGEKYNKLSEKWTNYLNNSLKEHNKKAMKMQKEKQNPFQ